MCAEAALSATQVAATRCRPERVEAERDDSARRLGGVAVDPLVRREFVADIGHARPRRGEPHAAIADQAALCARLDRQLELRARYLLLPVLARRPVTTALGRLVVGCGMAALVMLVGMGTWQLLAALPEDAPQYVAAQAPVVLVNDQTTGYYNAPIVLDLGLPPLHGHSKMWSVRRR